MLDIKLIRENPEIVKKSLEKRGNKLNIIDEVLENDKKWRETLEKIDELRHERNIKSREVGNLVKENKDANPLKVQMKNINKNISKLEEDVEKYLNSRNNLLMNIPNILDENVPIGKSEENNIPIKHWGIAGICNEHKDYFNNITNGNMESQIIEKKPKSHVDILSDKNLGDILRAGKIAGSRFYYLKNKLVLLELALERFALEYLSEKNYEIIEPPFMMNRKAYEGVIDFYTFEDTIYKIENEDLYLIATAEHPLAAMHMNEIFEIGELPKKYAGISPCFRKEAGAHGKDTKGIFRVHQFNKIEQFIFCEPKDSNKYFEELMNNVEEMYQKLKLPYRIVEVCSGDIGTIASRKQDIDVWMPSQGKFREVVSLSNTTDYQTRRLKIRYRQKENNIFPYTLNSTAIATTRTLVAIMENYQEKDVIKVPEVLKDYVNFEEI